MAQSDPGPTGRHESVMDATPDYQSEVGDSTTFWYAFGPVLYRGRLDGSARVLGVASDPGPPSVCRSRGARSSATPGKRHQGFLAKLDSPARMCW